MTDGDIAQNLAVAVGHTLPAIYLTFLDRLPARPTLGEGYGPILDFGGRRWRPYDRRRLAESVPGRRGDVPVPYAHETTRTAAGLQAADEEQGGSLSAELAAQGFSLDRLARGFCIGDDGNGEPLFVDPESGGVYTIFHDDMEVERWAGSLTELVAGSLDWLGDEDA
jgi:hypothetical protein